MTETEVMDLIPNRFPIIYIDYVDEMIDGKKIIATKNVTINEDSFQGHFPGNPVMPGALIIETLAQAGSILILKSSQFKGRKVEAIANGDGSFNINLDNGNNVYYIDSDSQILDSNDMIAIRTAEELKAFRDEVNSGNSYEGKYVYLTDNITLNINEEWTPIGLYPNDSSTPDNENNKPFKGIFDGKNHEINGIYMMGKLLSPLHEDSCLC